MVKTDPFLGLSSSPMGKDFGVLVSHVQVEP